MTDVKVRGATVEVRQSKLTRSLLKQFKRLRSIPELFRMPSGPNDPVRLNPEYTVGYIHGSEIGEEYGLLIVFIKDGDGFLYDWQGFKPEPWCKQIYIG